MTLSPPLAIAESSRYAEGMRRASCLLLVAVLILAGCAKPTEEQRLEKFRRSIKYRTYRLASEKATHLLTTDYNKTAARPVDTMVVHSTLGLLWFFAGKSEYSFVEADIVSGVSTGTLATLSLCLKSIALSRMKYPGLARTHYEAVRDRMAAHENADVASVELDHKVFLVSLIAVSMLQRDPELARFGADALAAISEVDYLPPLVSVVMTVQQGSVLQAADQLRELNKSERFSEHTRAIAAQMAGLMTNSTDPAKLSEELTDLVATELCRRVMEDIFTTEELKRLLDKTQTLPDLITGAKDAAPPAPSPD